MICVKGNGLPDIEKNIGSLLIDVDEFGKQLAITNEKSQKLITDYENRIVEMNTMDNY